MDTKQYLPIGIQSFEYIRENNYMYLDKTRQIWKLANTGKYYFLSRPRRFGKSLLLSTLKEYFKGRKELFEGLNIEKLESKREKPWTKHPVIHLDFSTGDYQRTDEIENTLNIMLREYESKDDKSNTENKLEYLIEKTDTTGHFSFPYQESDIEAKLNFIVGRDYIENVTEKDAQYIVDYLLGKVDMDKYQRWSADLNNDDKVTMDDVKKFRELLSGKIKYENISNKAKFYIINKDDELVEMTEAIKLDVTDYNIKCILKGNVIEN